MSTTAYKPLLGNHLIYNFGAAGTKMNWLDFKVKRSKVKVTVRPNALFQQRHTYWWFAIKHCVIRLMCSSIVVVAMVRFNSIIIDRLSKCVSCIYWPSVDRWCTYARTVMRTTLQCWTKKPETGLSPIPSEYIRPLYSCCHTTTSQDQELLRSDRNCRSRATKGRAGLSTRR